MLDVRQDSLVIHYIAARVSVRSVASCSYHNCYLLSAIDGSPDHLPPSVQAVELAC